MSMFGNRTANAENAAPNAPAPMRSKYGGIQCADTRDPMLDVGAYRVRVVSCAEGYNPGKRRDSYKVTLFVVDAAEGSKTPKGTTATMIAFMSAAGLAELKRFAMHAAGFGATLEQRMNGADIKAILLDAERQYDALDESYGYQGAILEASAGKPSNAPSLQGRLVDVIVTQGKPVMNPQTSQPTGDFYRVYAWGVVPESEQPK